MIESTSALTLLAQGYFHQDFRLEDPEPLGMVYAFIRDETPEKVDELISQVEKSLADLDESQLRVLWLEECHSSFDPAANGYTYREWFEKVLEVLREQS